MDEYEYINGAERMLVTKCAITRSPLIGTLELLPLCNMSCSMCYVRMNQSEVAAAGGLKPVSYWLDLARQMQNAGVLFLLLTGGEPLLYPGFKELYLGLLDLGMIVTINTNGTLVDEEWAAFFGEYLPRRINITLYGKDADAYEKICHYRSGYEKAVQAIRYLKKYDVPVKINGSVTEDNLQDMDAIYRFGEEHDIPVHMDTYMIPPVYEKNSCGLWRLTPEDAAHAEILALKREYSSEMFDEYCGMITEKIGHFEKDSVVETRCLAGRCSFATDWRGQLRPCVSMEGPAADLKEKGFLQAWEDISGKMLSLNINSACHACRLKPVCKNCVASAYLETGKYDGVPEYLCKYAKAYYNEILGG